MLAMCMKADSFVSSMPCFLQTTHPTKRHLYQNTMNHSPPISEIIFTGEPRSGPTITVRPGLTSRMQNRTVLPRGDCNSSSDFLFTDVSSGRKELSRPRFRTKEGVAARCYLFQWRLNVRILTREEILASGCSNTLTVGSPSLGGLDLG